MKKNREQQNNSSFYADSSGFIVDLRKKDDSLKNLENKSLKKDKVFSIFNFKNKQSLKEVKKEQEKKEQERKREQRILNKEIKKQKLITKKNNFKNKIKDLNVSFLRNNKRKKQKNITYFFKGKEKTKLFNNTCYKKDKKRGKILNLDYFSFDNLKKIYKQKKERKKRFKLINKKINSYKKNFLKKTSCSKSREFSPVFSFILILFFLAFPIKILYSFNFFNFDALKNKIINYSFGAIDNLENASNLALNFNLDLASLEFKKASTNFLEAENDLKEINSIIFKLASLSSDPQLKIASYSKEIVKAGKLISELGESISLATSYLFNQKEFNDSLNLFLDEAKNAADKALELKNIVNSIPEESVPEKYQKQFILLKEQSSFILNNLNKFIYSADNLKEVLGLSQDKRYLLVFQNNAELRASGGFLGSYALIDIRDGKIRNLEVPAGGSYDLEAGMQGKKIVSPKPLHLVNPHWNFWDANWWADWPKTAENLMWFYNESNGPTVDGVISFTPSVVEKILEITGPIDMTKEYGLIINSENFWELTQKTVEYDNLVKEDPNFINDIKKTEISSSTIINTNDFKFDQDLENNQDNKPKKIIGDLFAKIIEEIPKNITKDNLAKIITIMSDSVLEKQVMVYFSEQNLQNEIENLGLAGEVKESEHDYLMIVDTNIGGRKTDRILKREASLQTEIDSEGSIINTLTIEYAHPGKEGDPLLDVRNVNWLRVYVPSGSQLISAKGFSVPDEQLFEQPDDQAILSDSIINENKAIIDKSTQTKIYHEFDKTVFANWVMTDPGYKNKVVIKYKLPINLNQLSENKKNDTWLKKISYQLNPEQDIIFPYSLLIQKQPGVNPYEISFNFKESNNYSVFWSGNKDLQKNNYVWNYTSLLNSDKYISVLLKK